MSLATEWETDQALSLMSSGTLLCNGHLHLALAIDSAHGAPDPENGPAWDEAPRKWLCFGQHDLLLHIWPSFVFVKDREGDKENSG